jgi:hypothetical protein
MSNYLLGNRRARSGRSASGMRAAAAICAVGFLIFPVPAQAAPMFPLAPACQYGFTGGFGLQQSNGAAVTFDTNGPFEAVGEAHATGTGGSGTDTMVGKVSGGLNGNQLAFTIRWYTGPVGKYSGTVGDDGFAHGTTFDAANRESRATWDSMFPLSCVQPAAPPPPKDAPAPEQVPAPSPAGAVLGAVVNGPATLQAGLSGTYVVAVSNTGGVKAPVELFIIFAGKLEQTGQIGAQGGVDCVLQPPAAGVNATVRCVQSLEPGAKVEIVLQGRGSVPGAGTLLAKIGNNVSQKNVAIT